ncbi:uncharacterized protein, YkwD family [Oceanobacillus limi]|uniref:Uncharacterized protein, YkwD family n=1 Tax=Oceanobacillus limi TaxID=930131 RepID=A0A1I0CRB7_9BACI|nr:CAP domain-containing protein [Oceanobacillus limi]SET21791.1 uncharacterized protein, YkwD family [Oceanobacillus limi]
MQLKKFVLPVMFIMFVVLVACTNDDATNDRNNGDNGRISSISTNSPNEDYAQTQRPDGSGQGYGNNFSPIGANTGDAGNNERQAPQQPNRQYPPIPQQPQEQDQDQQQQQTPQQDQQPQQQEPETNRPSTQGQGLNDFEQAVVELTNEERRSAGLNELEVDATLSETARAKSEDMQANDYFSHNSPTYGSPFDMMSQFGVSYRSAAENIAAGQQSPEAVVQAWMNSEGHRENILNGGFTHIGVGFEDQGNNWTQMFIRK